MDKPLFFVAVILFLVGAWPIALAVLAFSLLPQKPQNAHPSKKRTPEAPLALIAIAVLAFCMRIWAIGIAALVAYIYIKRDREKDAKAKQEADEKFIDDIIAKTENREES